MVGAAGFEPTLAESESDVLPLNYAPIRVRIIYFLFVFSIKYFFVNNFFSIFLDNLLFLANNTILTLNKKDKKQVKNENEDDDADRDKDEAENKNKVKNKINKNKYALIFFLILFGQANAQDTMGADTGDKDPVKTEDTISNDFKTSADLQFSISGNMSQTYNGFHMDLLPVWVYGIRADYEQFSAMVNGVGCFTSIPMSEQKYQLMNGELYTGAAFQIDNNTVMMKVGNFSLAGKYGLTAYQNRIASTDVLYDLFNIGSGRNLNRGAVIICNNNIGNIAIGYTENDGIGGFKFRGKDGSFVLAGGHDGKKLSFQIIGFYSVKDANVELNFYTMYTPNSKHTFIFKALGQGGQNTVYEMVYLHVFNDVKIGTVVMIGQDEFANISMVLVLPYNISVNVSVVNNDPYTEQKGVNPKIGIGYTLPVINTKTR